ncbi:heat shock factor protein-like isoform X2 [Dermacentor andersoni]|uniref:heat shock factor protein-like isoform X2 n=1 Tax=Dermacentor andersoni TaxID=34620 RepID=UPI003B3AC55D
MHTTLVASNVPAFLVKLWKLVEDEKCNDLISWSSSGQSFIIHNQIQFAKELLPLYFKHSNMASFIRQLNMYGFRKVANIDQGLRSDREEIEFFHNFFIRGQECLLEFIKRKVPSSRAGGQGPEDGQARNEVLKELLTSAGNMQDRQERMDQLLADMKKENEALWREVARLRQKHMKQQQIVEKLIQFLVTMVQANRNITVKRKMPLMLHDSPSSTSKVPRLTKGALVTDYQVTSPGSSQYSEGPVIHDVTDLMEELGDTGSTVTAEPMTTAQSPRPVVVSTPLTPAQSSASPAFSSDLDAVPVVSSPLSTADAMEPLCLLDPLQDAESSNVLQCGIEEVVDSSEPSPPEPNVASPKGLDVPVLKAPQVVTPAASTVRLAFPSSNLVGEEDQTLLSDEEPANSTSDLLSSCVMLEDLPNFTGNVRSHAAVSPSTLAAPSTEVATEESSSQKESAAASPPSPGMQVALQEKTSGTTKIFADHVESIDSDLDWLQDQLSGGGLSLDTSTLMGVCPEWTGLLLGSSKLFSPEDTLASRLGDLATENRSSGAIGNELVQYTPSLLDLGIEESSSFQPVSELLLSDDDELPSTAAALSPVNDEPSIPRPSSLVTSEQSPSSQSASPSLLFQENNRSVVQTESQLAGKKGTSSGRKSRGGSKK